MQTIIDYLRKTIQREANNGLSDADLLAKFATAQDKATFAALVRRHGSMVLCVARRVLRHEQDAEDVFQATFLVLVRKAKAIRKPELLGNWLYGVAYRTALEAKSMHARRRMHETQVTTMPEAAAPEISACHDLPRMLDEELSRLADKYRAPIVLCHLEGRSRREVARQLRISEGTLSSRLATAKQQLARRLARRGLMLSAGVLASALSQNAYALPPALLVSATVQSALRLAAGSAVASITSATVVSLIDGVTKAMFIAKLKTLAVAFACLGVLGVALSAAASGALLPGGGSDGESAKRQSGIALQPLPLATDQDAKSPPAKKDIAGTQDKLDRQPVMVSVEVKLVDIPPALPGKGNTEKKLEVPGERQFKIVTQANQAGSVDTTQSKPYVTGLVTTTGTTGKQTIRRTVNYKDIGTKVQVHPEITGDAGHQLITFRLAIQDSQMLQPANGIPLGEDEKGEIIRATEFVTARFEQTVSIVPGKEMTVGELTLGPKAGGARTLVVVSARVQ